MDGDAEIGRVTTDARGEWVFIPPSKLLPGQRVLYLRQSQGGPSGGDPSGDKPSKADASAAGAEAPSGEVSDSVVLVIPDQGRDIAGRPPHEPGLPLVVVVPNVSPGSGTTRLARGLKTRVGGPL